MRPADNVSVPILSTKSPTSQFGPVHVTTTLSYMKISEISRKETEAQHGASVQRNIKQNLPNIECKESKVRTAHHET